MAKQIQTYIMLNQNGTRSAYAQIAQAQDGQLIFYDIWPLNPDIEDLEFAAPITAIGSVHTARIIQIDRKTQLVFLSLGHFDAVMKIKPNQKYLEGQYILAEIISDAYDDKKIRVRFAGEVKTGDKNRPSLFRQADNLAQYSLKLSAQNNHSLITDDFGFFATFKKQAAQDGANIDLAQVEITKKNQASLLEKHNLSDQIETLFQPQIKLENGGNIIIEHSQAMSIIDVNSGSYNGNNMNEDINKQAAVKIFEQLSLRNIGGLVIVDFLKFTKKPDRDRFGKYLRALSQNYQIEMGTYTGFGLVEFKIKRSGKRLNDKLSELKHD